ncbi:hypothetical protein EDD21DRAFT_368081 [Dissophora ornata]|nr:hypothetical protein EDD21DRAFT_368081 [Dissophora ornata]
MRGQVNSINSMEVIVQWIHSCCVLHNMLAHQGEPWQDAFIETKPRNLDRLQEPTAEARTFRDTLRKTVLETNTKRGVLIRR